MLVPRLLQVQVLALALCVVGALSFVDWQVVMDHIGLPAGAGETQMLFLAGRYGGAALALYCWWEWRRVARLAVDPSVHCAVCVHPVAADLCPECGTSHRGHRGGALLAWGLGVRSGLTSSIWYLTALLLVVDAVFPLILGVGSALYLGRDLAALLERQYGRLTTDQGPVYMAAMNAATAASLLFRIVPIVRAYRAVARTSA